MLVCITDVLIDVTRTPFFHTAGGAGIIASLSLSLPCETESATYQLKLVIVPDLIFSVDYCIKENRID